MKKKILLCLIVILSTIIMKSQTISDYNLLLVDGTGGSEIITAKSTFESLGHTVTLESSSSLVSGYDFSGYDVILFGRDSPEPPSMSEILALNTNNQLGIVLLRGDLVSSSVDIGSGGAFSGGNFTIENNSHYITQPFSSGVLDLGFTFKSRLSSVSANCTILGSISAGKGSLVTHNTYRRVLSPYYGHPAGTPSADALSLLDRIIAWAADTTVLSIDEYKSITNATIFPNPSTDFIQVTGLTKTENYKVYDILGVEIESNKISNNNEIRIQHLAKGIYFLIFDDGNTIKFLKK